MSKKYRCGNCGSLEVVSVENKGPFPWKDYPAVYLVKSISLLTCKKCGENILRHADVDKLDQAIEQSLAQLTQMLIAGILQREGCTQEELASRLGVTPQHLSHLKGGAKIPGFQTFNFLKTFYLDKMAFDKADPEINVGELKVANG